MDSLLRTYVLKWFTFLYVLIHESLGYIYKYTIPKPKPKPYSAELSWWYNRGFQFNALIIPKNPNLFLATEHSREMFRQAGWIRPSLWFWCHTTRVRHTDCPVADQFRMGVIVQEILFNKITHSIWYHGRKLPFFKAWRCLATSWYGVIWIWIIWIFPEHVV